MTFCGLDFGTSNSTIGIVRDSKSTMVPLEKDSQQQWQTTLPSALFFGFEDDQISFGREAIGRYTTGEPGRLLRSMKSLLGGSLMNDQTQIKNRLYSFDEIISFFISSIKSQAEAFDGNAEAPLNSVVMGRPIYFNDTDHELDRVAEEHLATIARMAGFKEVSFQFEPIAAAMDYEQHVSKEELALIIDIGGGTSDFTLVRLSPEHRDKDDRKQDFLSNHGVHIGGTDFDRQISVNSVMPHFGMGMRMIEKAGLHMPNSYYFDLATWHKIHHLYDRKTRLELESLRPSVSEKQSIDHLIKLIDLRKGHQLASLVEQAKIDLSSQPTSNIDLKSLFLEHEPTDIENCSLSQSDVDESLQRDVQKIFKTLDETIKLAGLSHDAIDTIFTTGGSTALPMIQARVKAIFPEAKHVEGDLYNSVGAGLVTEARRRYA